MSWRRRKHHHRRASLGLLAAALVALGLALATVGALAHLGSHSSSPERFAGPLMPPGLHATAFRLRDQNGQTATLDQYRGRVLILSFMYAACRETCPLMAQQIKGALDNVGTPIPALAISVSPKTDTPLSARRFMRRQGLDGRLRFLLGSQRHLAPIWQRYGIAPQATRSGHSSFVLLIDRRGVLRVGFPATQLTPEDLTHDLRILLAETPPRRS